MHDAICWLNGHISPAAEARISVLDHGLLYGDGVFEGIRYYGRRPLRLGQHLERLQLSARAIALELPYSLEQLTAAVHEAVAAAPGADGYLRLVVTRGSGALGLDPRSCAQPNVFIIAAPLQMVSAEERARGVRLVIAGTRRLPPDGLDPRIKSLNYLNHILARIEANAAGADEAILLNASGRVTEGTADNVFIVRQGRLLTPPASEGCLEGITRALVMELARAAELPVLEQPLAPYDLYTADECFLTGTGAELIPVAEIDGRVLPHCPGPVFQTLDERFQLAVRA